MKAPKASICGGPECTIIIGKVLQCASCKARSYCSKDCQRADWPEHREYCFPKDLLSQDAQQIRAYGRYHQSNLLALALCFFSFALDFAHLEGSDRRKWLPTSQQQYLHITLHRTDNAVRGRHNKIAFTTARLSDIDLLPEDIPDRVRSRLEARFPAICLGYSIVDTPGASQQKVTTYTHTFPWPATGYRLFRIPAVVRSIWLNEWILQKEAVWAQFEREKHNVPS